jgi:preprotein translocase SecE subunit
MANIEVPEKKPSGILQALKPVQEYFIDTVAELRKVHWPTQVEARNLTTVVLVTLLVMAAILGALDYGFEQLMLAVINVNIIALAVLAVVALAIGVLVVFASRSRNRY